MRGGRAKSYEEKRKIVERILDAWMLSPKLRLGQLMIVSMRKVGASDSQGGALSTQLDAEKRAFAQLRKLFNMEDAALAEEIEMHVKESEVFSVHDS